MEEIAATETVTEGLVLILIAFRQDANFNQDCYNLRICFARQFLSHLGRSAVTRHFAALQKSTFCPNMLGQRATQNTTTAHSPVSKYRVRLKRC